MLRNPLIPQHIHELVYFLLSLLVSQGCKFLIDELDESFLCLCPHLRLSCPKSRCQFCLREQLAVEISVTHFLLEWEVYTHAEMSI